MIITSEKYHLKLLSEKILFSIIFLKLTLFNYLLYALVTILKQQVTLK